jgi:hypothetical protein
VGWAAKYSWGIMSNSRSGRSEVRQYSTASTDGGGASSKYVDNSYPTSSGAPTLCRMHWDRLFEDLEGQLASDWEAERAVLDAESERLRIARLDLRARLRTLCTAATDATIDLMNGRRLPVTLHSLGADWLAVASRDSGGVRHATGAAASALLLPLHAVAGITTDHGMILASLDEAAPEVHPLRERMTLGFVLRDLARRRVPVHISLHVGDDAHGTIDRAAADHLDLALHDPGRARLAGAVQGFRIIPFSSLIAVRTPGDQLP